MGQKSQLVKLVQAAPDPGRATARATVFFTQQAGAACNWRRARGGGGDSERRSRAGFTLSGAEHISGPDGRIEE